MPILKHFDQFNQSQSFGSYEEEETIQKNLFAWQYVCSRLFKVSETIIPASFQYLYALEDTTQTIQTSLLKEYKERKNKDFNIVDINNFTNHSLINNVKAQAVPECFEKDYLLLDLLLTQKLLNEKGIDFLSEYGKNLISFVESLQNKSFKEVEVNLVLVNEIIDNEQKALYKKQEEIDTVRSNIKNAYNAIQTAQEELKTIELLRNKHKEQSEYVSDYELFSPSRLSSIKKDRLIKEKNMNLVDILKLKVFKYFGKNTNHFYQDNLEEMEKLLEQSLLKKSIEFKSIDAKLTTKEQELNEKIQKEKIHIIELKTILEANEVADNLTITTNLLDDAYIRDASRVMKQNNSIFLHSINDKGYSPDGNSPINEKVSFRDKVNQIACFSPSLSCSSFQLSNNSKIKEFAGPMGIIINQGMIASALSCDAGTRPNRYGERQFEEVTDKLMTNIIQGRSKDIYYDEFAITNTKIAGLYCNYDFIEKDKISEPLKNKWFLQIMEKLMDAKSDNPQTPIYILKDGHLCEMVSTSVLRNAIKVFKEMDVIKQNNLEEFAGDSLSQILNKCFIVSQPKNVQDVLDVNNDLDIEKKYDLAVKLLDNYKEDFKPIVNNKIEAMKTKIGSLREKFSQQNIATKYSI